MSYSKYAAIILGSAVAVAVCFAPFWVQQYLNKARIEMGETPTAKAHR